MANARLEVDKAMYSTLTVAGVLEVVPGGVHNMVAPQRSDPPFIVFQAMSKVDEHTFDGRFANMVYLVKAISKSAWPKEAMDVDTLINTTLEDAALSVTGYRLLLCRRESDFYFTEQSGGHDWQHIGGLYRILVDES